jgi:hypothetical protein
VTLVEAALELAALLRGRGVIPLHDVASLGTCTCGKGAACHSPGKHPRTPRGLKDASRDPDQIRTWWAQWPSANIGLVCGDGLAVLDVDGPVGEASLERLLQDRGLAELPETYEVTTQSGGAHLYYRVPPGVTLTNRSFGTAYPKLDVRGEGGYVVAPPSVGAKGPYVVRTDAPLEGWPREMLPPGEAAAAALADPGETTCERVENALERARAYLEKAEPAVQGQNGHARLLVTCAEAFSYGLTADEVFELIRDVYSPRCVPPFEDDTEILHKIEEARTKSEIARESWYAADRTRGVLRGLVRAEAAFASTSAEISDDEACRRLAKKTSNLIVDAAVSAALKGQPLELVVMPRLARAMFFRTKGGIGVEHALELLRPALMATVAAENALCDPSDRVTDAAVTDYAREALAEARKDYDAKQSEKDAKLAGIAARFAYVIPLERYFYKKRIAAGEVWDVSSPVGKDGVTAALQYEGFELPEIQEVIKTGGHLRAHAIDCVVDGEAIEERDGQAVLNCYVPPTLIPKAGACPSIERLLVMLTGDDPGGVAWLKNWIASVIQSPGVRSITAPVLYSRHTGTGKTTLGKVIRTILGPANCSEIGQSQLAGNFNSYFAKSLFVVANEIFTSDKQQDQANRMKPLITDETIVVNTKGVKEYQAPNRTSWLITSNSKTPVRLEGETDRRYSIFCSGAPDAAYKDFLAGLFGPDRDFTAATLQEIAAFAAECLAMDVDHALAGRPYESEARAELADVTRPVEEEFLQECFEVGPAAVVAEYPPEFWRDAPPADATWSFGQHGISQKVLGGALQTYCKRHGRYQVTIKRFTAVAKEHGLKVGRLGFGSRAYVYHAWPEPELQVETPRGRTLRPVPSLAAGGALAVPDLRGVVSGAFSGMRPDSS